MIIIFIPNGIGDVLMLVPALRRLLKIQKNEDIGLVVQGAIHTKIIQLMVSPTLKIIERKDGKPFSQLRLWFKLFFSKADCIIAPMLSNKPIHIAFFLTLMKKVKTPSTFVSKKMLGLLPLKINLDAFEGHQVNYFVSFIADSFPAMNQEPVGIDEILHLNLTQREFKDVRSLKRIAVGISCGDKERHKIPSPKFFAQYVNSLAQYENIEVLVLGDSSDLQKIEEFTSELNREIKVESVISMPINNLIHKLAACDLGVSGTTGQGHIMAAADLPMLVFCGVTDPRHSGPYVSRAALVSHMYSCGPCYQEKFRFGCGLLKCMDTIDINDAVFFSSRLLRDPNFGVDWITKYKKLEVRSLEYIKNYHAKFI